jgi:hypothetical protein
VKRPRWLRWGPMPTEQMEYRPGTKVVHTGDGHELVVPLDPKKPMLVFDRGRVLSWPMGEMSMGTPLPLDDGPDAA